MSTRRSTGGSHAGTSTRWEWVEESAITPRTLALVGLAVLALGYVTTLYWVTTVAGGTAWLAGGVAIGLGAGVLLRNAEERTVAKVAVAGAAIAGGLYYSSAAPAIDAGRVLVGVGDALAMLTGITVLRLAAVDVWIAALVPIPIFLTTYLGLRRRYGLAVLASGWLVCFLAATGDATLVETLLGSVGAVAAVGFGELDRRGGSVRGVDLLVGLIAVMAVLAFAVPMVPSGTASAVDPTGYGGDSDSVVDGEGSGQAGTAALDEQLLSGDDVSAGGPIELSPDVRFVVASEERNRYRLDVLDRYDGNGWTRTGRNRPSLAVLPTPPGESRTVTQRFDLRAPAEDVPGASYPVDVEGVSSSQLAVTTTGAITVDGRLPEGTNLTVRSEVPDASEADLRNAGTDYPAAVERRYTRLPEDEVPDRVYDLTDDVTAQSSNPYETARAIETYLQENKEYSQNVSAPSGTMADGFLFEMDAGYCTYFASTMATMLRTQGVPARVAVGYSGGQWVGNDTWVVRGTDAHAWVEVYFPEVGWVEFDPTPSDDVQDARSGAVEEARANGTDAVDVPESADEELRFERPPETDGGEGGGEPNGTDGGESGNATDGGNSTDTGGSERPAGAYSGVGFAYADDSSNAEYVEPNMTTYRGSEEVDNATATNETDVRESGERLLGGFDLAVVVLLLAAGTVAGGRQAGVHRRLKQAGTVLWQRRRDPETDVQVAMERLDAVLAERFEPRHDGETRREYRRRLPDHLDSEIGRAFELHERVRYAGEVDRETADELVGLVDGIARRRVPVLRRLG